ncbi:MAG: hypothetical protein JOZ15_16285, partial [Acidobacteria bacterium]|nr:hypothetical protein [Acidobacteriota bacterium]
NTDTPLPPDEPAGTNPPDGAVVDYLLPAPAAGAGGGAGGAGPVAGSGAAAAGSGAASAGGSGAGAAGALGASAPGEVVLEIVDAGGELVRRFSSADRLPPVDPKELAIPMHWVRPPRALTAAPGMHRFIWDLRYPPPDALRHEYPIAAVVHDTPAEPLGPLVLPGNYQVKLTAGGQTLTQTLEVKMDPRVRTPVEGLARQLKLARAIVETMAEDAAALRQVNAVRTRLASLPAAARKGALGKAVAAVDAKAAALAAGAGEQGAPAPPAGAAARRHGGAAAETSLAQLNDQLGGLLVLVDGADEPPTTQQDAGFAELERRLAGLRRRWDELRGHDLERLNARLRDAGLAPVATE